MALEQHSQILTPTNIKKRKTIPPELIVDIFKTIGTDKYLFTIYETKYGFIKVLSEDLWNRYAKKLLSCSSIIYLAAKNIFRQVKKKGKFTFYLSKMDAENNPNPEEWPVLTDPLMEALKKASVFQENEANVGNPEMIDYWVVVFKSAMAKMERNEKNHNNEKGLLTNNYEKEIRERDAQIRRLSASQTSNIGLGLLTSASALFNQGIAKLIEARNAFGGGGTPVIGSPTSASKNLCTSMSSSKMIGTPKSPRSTTSTPSSSKRKQVPPGLCPVCELRNKEESAYRIFTCSLCKNFFKRVIGCKFQPTAGCGKNCSKEDLLKCEHCWYMKCLNAGMKSLQQSTHKRKLSMDESEKLPKEIKLAESERKSSDDEAVGGTSPQQ